MTKAELTQENKELKKEIAELKEHVEILINNIGIAESKQRLAIQLLKTTLGVE